MLSRCACAPRAERAPPSRCRRVRRAQYWFIGFIVLCVILVVLEGRGWYTLLWSWIVNMGFALLVVDW